MIIWAIWRRLYGEGTFKKYVNRTLQTIFAVVLLAYQLGCVKDCGKLVNELLIVFAVSIWVIIQYWSRAIGEIIDAGLNNTQDRHSYNMWFKGLCNFVIRIINKILPEKYHIYKYQGVYDCFYSFFRYGVGALPLFWWSWKAFLLIPFQYFIYLGCHKLFAKYPSMFTNKILVKLTINEPKNLAEIIHGGLFGAVIGAL